MTSLIVLGKLSYALSCVSCIRSKRREVFYLRYSLSSSHHSKSNRRVDRFESSGSAVGEARLRHLKSGRMTLPRIETSSMREKEV